MEQSPPCDRHDARLSVLETRTDYLENAVTSQGKQLDNIDGKVDSINEHLARQNGAIPHMSESIKTLNIKMDDLSETKWQNKTLWSFVGAAVAGILGFLINMWRS